MARALDSATYLATNVTAIRRTFQDPCPTSNESGAPYDGTVIRELLVFGVVPEPTSAVLGMAGVMMGLCRRERRGAN